jgi:hypothetical protein
MKVQLSEWQHRRCTSYLLRLWQVRSEDGMVWRASLESVDTGERKGFASLDTLLGSCASRRMPDQVLLYERSSSATTRR